MSDKICPFCGEDEFDEIGLVYHFVMNCPQYDHACRRAADEADRRATPPDGAKGER
ncbi:hypothetical protein [Pseudoxanthomonas beigongshangi]